jgi:fructose-1,6-bisphosphatase I
MQAIGFMPKNPKKWLVRQPNLPVRPNRAFDRPSQRKKQSLPMLVTLNEFILDRQNEFPYASGDLTRLLSDIGTAAKIVNHKVNKAGLSDIVGEFGNTNVQGEAQQKLDVFADNAFIHAFRTGGMVCGIGSEENDDFVAFDSDMGRNAKYVVLFDPLDGSSNIDVNVSIGTIFSIFRRKSPVGTAAVLADFLQKGSEQVAAGYVIYGSSTMLVYTTGCGVNGFTLEPAIGEFFLSHPNMKIPAKGKVYSINESNYTDFDPGLRKFVDYCRAKTPVGKRPYTARYIGSLVADFHRNLIKGGIYIYPAVADAPQGKLRLLYECAPLAFIAEQAGGLATDGRGRIMDIQPTSLHQRAAYYVGSREMMEKAADLASEAVSAERP